MVDCGNRISDKPQIQRRLNPYTDSLFFIQRHNIYKRVLQFREKRNLLFSCSCLIFYFRFRFACLL